MISYARVYTDTSENCYIVRTTTLDLVGHLVSCGVPKPTKHVYSICENTLNGTYTITGKAHAVCADALLYACANPSLSAGDVIEIKCSQESCIKYIMPDEKYDALDDTARKFLARLPQYHFGLPKAEFAERYPLESRCQVKLTSIRGTIKAYKPRGRFYDDVVIMLDEPFGDGSHSSILPELEPKYGMVLPSAALDVGAFPPLDPFDDEI